MNQLHKELNQLASLYGVQVSYNDVEHRRRNSSAEAMMAVLKALGAPIMNTGDITSAIIEKRNMIWRDKITKVITAWNGILNRVTLRIQSSLSSLALTIYIILESGEKYEWRYRMRDLQIIQTSGVEGVKYEIRQFKIPLKLPLGYHQLTIELGKYTACSLIISAPRKAYTVNNLSERRHWGIFIPLYGLLTENSWGGGDFSDLNTLLNWAHSLGAGFVATLPLLSTFFDNTCDLSPYSPASRLFWNEAYLDMQAVINKHARYRSAADIDATEFREKLNNLRNRATIDYRAQRDLKRNILEQLIRQNFLQYDEHQEEFRSYIKQNPLLEDYASFRAACERRLSHWPAWPNPQKDGLLTPQDYTEDVKCYYIYSQWLADEQLERLSQNAAAKKMRLCFDLPLGVSPDSFDVWCERTSFIHGISAGAPPDSFFTKGQKWGITPLHPEGLRDEKYHYYIACLRHNLKYAGIMRIDHIMSYHRLYVIPDNFEADQGVYIHYHAPELYAICCLESARAGSIMLGEDLGTVPVEVRKTMTEHALYRHYVVQYEIIPSEIPLPQVPRNVVASINTHDMPTFASFWRGDDIYLRYKLGLLNEKDVETERTNRSYIREMTTRFLWDRKLLEEPQTDEQSVLKAILAFLSSSKAQAVLINLEDLWLETSPQNTPGTMGEELNYCRMLQYTFEQFSKMPGVLELLEEVNRRRRE